MNSSQPLGFHANPTSNSGPGILVLHAWWGLNDTIKSFCNRLAESGFIVFAPDLYHGKIAKTIPEAEILGKAVDDNHQQTNSEIAEAARYLVDLAGKTDQGLAVIGFSLGAYFAVHLAATQPEFIRSVVLFYGSGDSDLSASKASFMGHYAENDKYEPPSYAENLEKYLKKLGRPVSFYHYPGTKHWFFEPDRPQEYDPAAAKLAWERTLKFLKDQSK